MEEGREATRRFATRSVTRFAMRAMRFAMRAMRFAMRLAMRAAALV
jgi:hypothetical protein